MIYRELKPSEYDLLKTFLYEAIYIPEGMTPPSRSIIELPELKLYQDIITLLNENGYSRLSLSVQKANYAVRMYERAGFRTVRETEEEYIMILWLPETKVKTESEFEGIDDDIHDPCLRFQK